MAAKKTRAARAKEQRNGTPPIELPDVLGDDGRRQTLNAVLRDLQDQKFRIDVMKTMNKHKMNDKVPGTEAPGKPEGKTYRERYDEIEELESVLRENYADILAPQPQPQES